MKFSVILSCFGVLVFTAWADDAYRDFTDTKGRTIRGRVLSFDARAGSVKIERDNKRTSTVPLDIFSDSDQAYIHAWSASKCFTSDRLLKISCDDRLIETSKEEEVGDIRYTSGSVEKDFVKTVTTFEKIAYEFQFQNKNAEELNNIRMEYRIYYEQSKIAWGEPPVSEQLILSGEIAVPPLSAQSKSTVTTKPVTIHEDDIRPVPQAGGDQRRGGKGEVHGLRARLYMKLATGEEVMREFCHPESLSDNEFAWQ